MYEENSDRSLAEAIVEAIDAPLLVLDRELTVVAASGSYYRTFNVERATAEGRHIAHLGDGEWDIGELHQELEAVLLNRRALEAFEVQREFSNLGRRIMRIAAREMAFHANPVMLVEITDITAVRSAEMDAKELIQRKEMLLEEMSHRFANSLMIIASILLLRAQTTRHEETRLSLEEAHQRVIAVAAVQRQLRTLSETDEVEMEPYLSQLCESLTASMVDDRARITLDVQAGINTVSSGHAVHVGLIVTELVINSLKHGYPNGASNGRIAVRYELVDAGWTLSVSDNGIGRPKGPEEPKPGLGTLIVDALARQLDAELNIAFNPWHGRVTTIRHAG